MTLYRDWWRVGPAREWRDEKDRVVPEVVEGANPPFLDIITHKRPDWPTIRIGYTHWGLKMMIRRIDAEQNERLRAAIASWPMSADKEIIWCNEDWSFADE